MSGTQDQIPPEFEEFLGLFNDSLPDSERERLRARLLEWPDAAEYFTETLALQDGLQRFQISQRQFCPSQQQLVDFAERSLGTMLRSRITHHLETCPMCAEDYADLEALLSPPTLELAFAWVNEKLSLVKNALGELLPEPELALARNQSAAQAWTIERQSAGARLKITVSHSDGRWLVRISLDREGQVCWFSALLFHGDQVTEGAVCTPLGKHSIDSEESLSFELTEPGAYQIAIDERIEDDSSESDSSEEGTAASKFHETLSLNLGQDALN